MALPLWDNMFNLDLLNGGVVDGKVKDEHFYSGEWKANNVSINAYYGYADCAPFVIAPFELYFSFNYEKKVELELINWLSSCSLELKMGSDTYTCKVTFTPENVAEFVQSHGFSDAEDMRKNSGSMGVDIFKPLFTAIKAEDVFEHIKAFSDRFYERIKEQQNKPAQTFEDALADL